jgi:hypothetical protein
VVHHVCGSVQQELQMTITREEVATQLNGLEYGFREPKDLFDQMKAAGLVCIYGYSDDGAEWRGAIYDETFSETVHLDEKGIMQSECDCDDCPYFKRLLDRSAIVTPVWDRDGISWQYETRIPHVTFDIMEDGEIYCRGIVFAMADIKEAM